MANTASWLQELHFDEQLLPNDHLVSRFQNIIKRGCLATLMLSLIIIKNCHLMSFRRSFDIILMGCFHKFYDSLLTFERAKNWGPSRNALVLFSQKLVSFNIFYSLSAFVGCPFWMILMNCSEMIIYNHSETKLLKCFQSSSV